jgi:hypothetical protein
MKWHVLNAAFCVSKVVQTSVGACFEFVVDPERRTDVGEWFLVILTVIPGLYKNILWTGEAPCKASGRVSRHVFIGVIRSRS